MIHKKRGSHFHQTDLLALKNLLEQFFFDFVTTTDTIFARVMVIGLFHNFLSMLNAKEMINGTIFKALQSSYNFCFVGKKIIIKKKRSLKQGEQFLFGNLKHAIFVSIYFICPAHFTDT